MEYKDDYYTLSSGRKFYSNNGIIGLGMYEGSDGSIDDRDFTLSERREVAEYCIEEWEEYGKVGILRRLLVFLQKR